MNFLYQGGRNINKIIQKMEQQFYLLRFHGKGFDFFKIQLVNLILCVITLGLYYPWAKARTLSYLYSQTSFENQPFIFSEFKNLFILN